MNLFCLVFVKTHKHNLKFVKFSSDSTVLKIMQFINGVWGYCTLFNGVINSVCSQTSAARGPTHIQRRQCVILSVCCCGIFLFRTGCQLRTWLVSASQDSHWHEVKMIATTSSKCLCQWRIRSRYNLHCKGQIVCVTGSQKNVLLLSSPLLWRPLSGWWWLLLDYA